MVVKSEGKGPVQIDSCEEQDGSRFLKMQAANNRSLQQKEAVKGRFHITSQALQKSQASSKTKSSKKSSTTGSRSSQAKPARRKNK